MYLALSRYSFTVGEYGRTITAKIYNEDLTAPTLNTYSSITFEFLDYDKAGVTMSVTGTIGSTNTATLAFSATQNPTVTGLQWVRAKLEKTGEVSYTEAVRIIVQ